MGVDVTTHRTSLRNALSQVAGFTFLNPHVYLDTVLLMGSIGARQPADMRFWFIGGAAAASGAWFTTLGFGARLLRPVFRTARAWQVLDTLVGVTMLAIAASLLARVL
jgi:L-lysine exporter family protein LysE/ArgO